MHKKWVITFDRKENILIKIFRIVGLFDLLICLILAIVGNVENSFWILPITYFMGMLFLGNNNLVKNTPGMITLNVVLFCKYSILPVVIYITEKVSVFSIGYEYISYAIALMWLELISIFLVIGYTGSKKKKIYKNLERPNEQVLFKNQYVKIVFVIIFATLIVLLARFPYLIGGIKIFLEGSLDNSNSLSDFSSFAIMFWKAATTWIYIYIMSELKKMQLKGRNINFSLLLISMIYLLLTFIGQTTIARWYTIISYVTVLYFVKFMFPKSLKYFLYGSVVPFVTVILVASIYKNTDFLSSSENFIESLNGLFDITVLDAYFSGPICVNNAIYVYKTGEGDFFSLFFDMIRNMPIVNHLVDISHSTVKIYAKYMGRKDQIIPLVGQSLIYFGPLLSTGLSMLAVIIVRKFDDLYLKGSSAMVFVSSYCAVWTAVIFMLNLTVYVSGFYSTIIPIAIMLWFTIPKIKQ